MQVSEGSLQRKFAVVLPHLDERQRRLLLGAEAQALGRGGITAVSRAAGVSLPTVRKGLREIEAGTAAAYRVRRRGGGRKPVSATDPGVVEALEALVDSSTLGDPQSPLRWTSKSTRTLAEELSGRRETTLSYRTVGKLLRRLGYSLQAPVKTREGKQHPDRDAQFRYLAARVNEHLAAGDPVVSVDTKKKELVGNYKNGGRQWRPAGQPEEVNVHDFPGDEGKAIPYGVYDVAADAGWVGVGRDHDTAAFAVATLGRWWQAMGQPVYTDASRLLVCADGGGSNGSRTRLWKVELAALAAQTGLAITVCHLPPGTSKWNKIEHRLFSHITMNWRGQTLESHEAIVQLIAATTTRTGLTVQAELDDGSYPKGVKISDQQMAALPLHRHQFHGDWNYTLQPRRTND